MELDQRGQICVFKTIEPIVGQIPIEP